MNQLAEAIFGAALVVMAVLIGDVDPIKRIHKVDMCVMRHDGSIVNMEVWSDYVARYQLYYPGSVCGVCGKERSCPKS